MISKQIKFKKNLLFKRILFLMILVMTLFVIFNFSEQNGEVSSSFSIKITEYIINLVSKIKNMDIGTKLYYIEKLHPIIRKFAHFAVYTVVGFATMGFMCTFDIRNILKLTMSLSIGIVYAIADEIHQGFIPGRAPSIIDVGIDALGVLTGIFLLIILIVFLESIVNWLKR